MQFSSDINPDTLKGNVWIAYSTAQAIERGEPQAPSIEAKLNYNRGTRVIESSSGSPSSAFARLPWSSATGLWAPTDCR